MFIITWTSGNYYFQINYPTFYLIIISTAYIKSFILNFILYYIFIRTFSCYIIPSYTSYI
jgi:hypothetical protein